VTRGKMLATHPKEKKRRSGKKKRRMAEKRPRGARVVKDFGGTEDYIWGGPIRRAGEKEQSGYGETKYKGWCRKNYRMGRGGAPVRQDLAT